MGLPQALCEPDARALLLPSQWAFGRWRVELDERVQRGDHHQLRIREVASKSPLTVQEYLRVRYAGVRIPMSVKAQWECVFGASVQEHARQSEPVALVGDEEDNLPASQVPVLAVE